MMFIVEVIEENLLNLFGGVLFFVMLVVCPSLALHGMQVYWHISSRLMSTLSKQSSWIECSMCTTCPCLQREVLMKELERERQLRIEAENRLRDERLDVCDCKSRAAELQKELARLKPDLSTSYN